MKFPQWSEKRLRELADAEDAAGCINIGPPSEAVRFSDEELKIFAGTDPAIAATLEAAGIKPENVEKVVVPMARGWREAWAKGLPDDYRPLRDGEPCTHPGCLRHLTHPCEGCGRVGGRSVSEELDPGCLMRGKSEKDGLCSGPCPSCAQERRRRAREGK
jgi:hypothetical protein